MLRIEEDFTKHVYDRQMYRLADWKGIPVQKYPTDLWTYADLLYQQMPDIIIETGTYAGGSAHFFADLLHLYGKDDHIVISIDINPVGTPHHPNVQYLQGTSTDTDVLTEVLSLILPEEKVMVILDSDHTAQHVREELREYARFVTPGQYLVIEDTVLNGHPVEPNYGPGPMEAMEQWEAEDEIAKYFVRDRRWEKFGMSFHPMGFLQRKASYP